MGRLNARITVLAAAATLVFAGGCGSDEEEAEPTEPAEGVEAPESPEPVEEEPQATGPTMYEPLECPDGQHDGGDRTCVADGECAGGFQTVQGRCVGWMSAGQMTTARSEHTLTALGDGRVLAAGGSAGSGSARAPMNTAELYNPATNEWTAVAPMNTARRMHGAGALPGGRVLVAGGYGPDGALASVEVYDPAADTWTEVGELAQTGSRIEMAALPDGKVLMVGHGNHADVFDPEANEVSATGALTTSRNNPAITVLSDGRVLVAGGSQGMGGSTAAAEIYDPEAGTWSATGEMTQSRGSFEMVTLADGRAIAIGGCCASDPVDAHASTDIFDPEAGTWSAGPEMSQGRQFPVAQRLPSGRVLVTAGTPVRATALATTEVLDPEATAWATVPELSEGRSHGYAAALPDGSVLVAGGSTTGPSNRQSAELFRFTE